MRCEAPPPPPPPPPPKDETMESETDQPAAERPPPDDRKRKTRITERRRRLQQTTTTTTTTTTVPFKLDPSTANGSLALSADHATATYVREDQAYASHPARFAFWQQVLCTEGLAGGGPGAGGRWYWEVAVTGWVSVGLAYDSIARGRVDGGLLGYNDRSWSLAVSEVSDGGGGGGTRYTACHNKSMIERHSDSSPSSSPSVIGVYLDWDEGHLSFYRGPKASEDFEFLHTFSTTSFDGPLYPAFRLGWYGSSVSLLQLTRM